MANEVAELADDFVVVVLITQGEHRQSHQRFFLMFFLWVAGPGLGPGRAPGASL
jgi:hypothetical protein